MNNTMQSLRIAVDATNIAPGGGLVVLTNYIRCWREGFPNTSIVAVASRTRVIDSLCRLDGVEVHRFHPDRPAWQVFWHRQRSLSHVMRAMKPDVVLVHNTLLANCTIPQVLLHQGQWTLIRIEFWRWVRSSGFPTALAVWARHHAVIKSISQASCNVFISRYMMEQARCFVPDSLTRNYVVHNGVRLPDNYEQLVQDQPRRDRQPVVLAIQPKGEAKPYPHKDAPTLIRAMAECVRRRPDVSWKLSIIGRGNWDTEKRHAKDLGILERIEFIDECSMDELYRRLQQSLCLLFPSVMEGFGLPPLEAMANGTPVIAAESSAIPEVVGEAGILVRPCDVKGFADKVIRLHEDAAFRERLIHLGLERARTFSWHKSATKLHDLLYRCGKGML